MNKAPSYDNIGHLAWCALVALSLQRHDGLLLSRLRKNVSVPLVGGYPKTEKTLQKFNLNLPGKPGRFIAAYFTDNEQVS